MEQKSLKILLIQPSSRDCVRTLFSIYNSEEGIGFKPPIGLLYIATMINQRTRHQASVLDCQLDDIHQGNILEYVDDSCDVVGISAWTDFWFQAWAMGKKIKEKYPKIHLTMGGPHVNIFPEEIMKFDFVDSIIMGDGEYPMMNLLDRLSGTSRSSAAIVGVYFKGDYPKEFVPYVCEDLDSLPIPDRTLLPVDRYTAVISPVDYVTNMISSRGCPFRCVYCKMKFQKPVSRSAANVIAEFKQIADMGIKEVEVYDDTFNWNHQRTEEICRGILDHRLNIRWAIRDRVDRADERIYALLRKAGCYRIHLGVETGVDAVMKKIKKGIRTEQVMDAVKMAKKFRFTILTYFMFGLPGETVEDAKKTIEFALKLNTDYAQFSITIPYPGTEAYDQSLAEGIIPFDYWREFTRHPVPEYVIPYVIENLISQEELIALRDQAIRKYYFRPQYMAREIFRTRSLKEFRRKFDMGIGLLNLLKKKLKR